MYIVRVYTYNNSMQCTLLVWRLLIGTIMTDTDVKLQQICLAYRSRATVLPWIQITCESFARSRAADLPWIQITRDRFALDPDHAR